MPSSISASNHCQHSRQTSPTASGHQLKTTKRSFRSDRRSRLQAQFGIDEGYFPLFFGDAANYGISLFVVGMALRYRAMAALTKGGTMGLFGLW
jgi:hypothetical protein